MFMSKYNSDILESFSEEFFQMIRPCIRFVLSTGSSRLLLFDRTRYRNMKKKHAAHIAHVVEANYSSEMFLQNLDILGEIFKMMFKQSCFDIITVKTLKVILDLSTTNIENMEEIEVKVDIISPKDGLNPDWLLNDLNLS